MRESCVNQHWRCWWNDQITCGALLNFRTDWFSRCFMCIQLSSPLFSVPLLSHFAHVEQSGIARWHWLSSCVSLTQHVDWKRSHYLGLYVQQLWLTAFFICQLIINANYTLASKMLLYVSQLLCCYNWFRCDILVSFCYCATFCIDVCWFVIVGYKNK